MKIRSVHVFKEPNIVTNTLQILSKSLYTFIIIIIRFVTSKSFISVEYLAILIAMSLYNNKSGNSSIHFTGRAKASIT